MARIASSVIDEIKQRNIIDIISNYVELNRRGRSVLGLCPFHSEKTPSFHVHEEKGFFKCFGCNEAGDAITFIMKYKNLDYPDAITYICENYGIELKYDEGNTPQKPIGKLKDIHEEMLKYSNDVLFSQHGEEALKYLLNRGFSEEILKRFELGFVPNYTSADIFQNKYSRDVISDSGIFYYDRNGVSRCHFNNRILFPIKSSTGACIGFSGRSMDPNDKAKYKNTSETPLFAKRRELFNLHNARAAMAESKTCYIVEGYFDVMRMVEAGYSETVAIMGTAFTKEQVNQLKRYTEEYNIILDGDEAGLRAMHDSREIALDTGVFPNIVILPDGEDPDTFIQKQGRDAFQLILDKKEDLLIHTIQKEAAESDDPNRKFYRLKDVRKVLQLIKDPYRKDYYVAEVAKIFDVSKERLKEDILAVATSKKAVVVRRKAHDHSFICEKDFFGTLIQLSDESVFRLLEDMQEDYFEDHISRDLYNKMVELFDEFGTINTLVNAEGMSSIVVELVSRDFGEDVYAVAITNKNRILLNHFNKKRIQLIDQLPATHADEKGQLLAEWQKTMEKIRFLQAQLTT